MKKNNNKSDDKEQEYYCPLCKFELKVKEGAQYDGIHQDDLISIGLAKERRFDEKPIVCPNPECKKNLHAFKYKGYKSMRYKHWIEKYLELPQRFIKKRGNLFGTPAKWKICLPFMALSLALFLDVFVYNSFYYITGKMSLVDHTYGFFNAVFSFGFILFFYYILREIKISIGLLEKSFKREYGKRFVYKILYLFYKKSYVITLIALGFVFIISLIDNVTFESYLVDFALIGNKIIIALGITIGICYFLLLMAVDETQLKGDYFTLKNRIEMFLNLSLKIILFIAIIGAIWKIGSVYVLSTGFMAAHPLNITFILYTIALPLASVLVPFIVYSIFIYRLNNHIRKDVIKKINRKISKLVKHSLGKSVSKSKQELLNTLFMIEDRIKKSGSWILEPRVFLNLVLAVSISVSPNILSKII